jgi:hypothetical protein
MTDLCIKCKKREQEEGMIFCPQCLEKWFKFAESKEAKELYWGAREQRKSIKEVTKRLMQMYLGGKSIREEVEFT